LRAACYRVITNDDRSFKNKVNTFYEQNVWRLGFRQVPIGAAPPLKLGTAGHAAKLATRQSARGLMAGRDVRPNRQPQNAAYEIKS
jgi:hypothetical protein